MATLFEQLLEYKWRGASFPVTEMSVSLQHDKASHAAWNRQGENIENTGRKSLVFRAQIPFYNTIVPGKGETWGVLYPQAYRAFLNAMSDPSTGVLTNPELGEISCKPDTCETSYNANKRGGCDVSATWIETIDLNKQDVTTVGAESPIREVELSALNLDNDLANNPALTTNSGITARSTGSIRGLAPTLPKRITSFQDMVRAISSVGDQTKLYAARTSGMVARIDYAANKIMASITLKDDPLLMGVKRNAIRMRSGAVDLKQTIEALNGASLVIFRVPQTSTLVGLSQTVGVPLGNVLAFNPRLAAKPTVAAGTVIKFKR